MWALRGSTALAWWAATCWALVLLPTARAWDCAEIAIPSSSRVMDLSSLNRDLNVTTAWRDVAPTREFDSFMINLCQPLATPSDGSETCPAGTFVCEYTYNAKGADTRINYLRPWATGPSEPAVTSSGPNVFEIRVPGGTWNGNQLNTLHRFECDEKTSAYTPPTISPNYEGGLLMVFWRSQAGCDNFKAPSNPSWSDGGRSNGNGSGSGDGTSANVREMSAAGFFVLIVFVMFMAYFVLGSMFNYAVNGVRGLPDLIPHHQFWLNLNDVVRDGIVAFRSWVGRRTNSGYVSLPQ